MEPVDSIWMDGDLVDWDDAQVHVLTHALHYGSGVFEGIRAYDTDDGPAVFRLDEHLERFLDSAEICDMVIDYEKDELVDAIETLITENDLDACYIRPLAYRGYGKMGLNPEGTEVNTMIAVWPWGAYLGEDALTNGVDITTSSWRRHSPDTMPTKAKATGNYLNSVLAKAEAVRDGYDEAIMLTEDGKVSEGTGENVFIVRDGELYTPPRTSVLEGITRKSVIQIAQDRGYTVNEEQLTRDQIYKADEAFFTGTAAEVTPIASLDQRDVSDGRGPITEELQSAFMDAARGELDDYRDWLHVV
ncbi:MAG: branched-chain amino acid transaminase [Candidatus Nanohaloarchaea archaeon]|nr:branched-chain amino acid transaminase [Candidatus Nanohaloarchaea archaeon]